MSEELIIAGVMIVSLTFYVLMAGADYGGGVWDFFVSGPRAADQRALIADVMGPIWEANHVWLILVVVILFTAFPAAFVTISTALNIPLTFMLIGIVLRGSAFSFRTYDSPSDLVQKRWSRVFSIASLITPVMLGICVGAISSGKIISPITVANFDMGKLGPALGRAASAHGTAATFDFFGPWFSFFSLSIGLFALAIFAFLAATYLTGETNSADLQEDFRKRALTAQIFVAVMALTVFLLAKQGAPDLWLALTSSSWTWPLHGVTAIVSCGAIFYLWTRRYHIARILAAGQAGLILWGWALAQFPYLIRPDITIHNAAAPEITLHILLISLCVGVLLLFPSFYYLLYVFNQSRAQSSLSSASKE